MKRKIFSILFAVVLILSLSLIPAALVGADPGPGLVGLWHLDEGIGSTALDSSAYGNDGTLSGGKFGNALSFDGNDDYVDCGSDSSLDITDAITIEAWVKPSAFPTTGYSTIATKALAYYFHVDDSGYLRVYQYGTSPTGYHSSANPISLDVWQHVAYTYDGSNVRIFINGAVDTTIAVTETISVSNMHLGIGMNLDASGNPYLGFHRQFQGELDEVRISNVARTSFDLTSPPSVDSNTVGLWHFDENVSSTAYDETANDNDGTIYGASWAGPTWTTSGKLGNALSFDGSDDYVQLPASNTILDTDTFTVEAWFKTSVNHPLYGSGEGRMVNLARDAAGFSAVALYLEENNIAVCYHTGSAFKHLKYTVDYHDDVWHYIAVTHDATTTYRLYYDGSPVALQGDAFGDFGTSAAYLATFNSLERFFNGSIDEVRIWDEALTATEIEHNYSLGEVIDVDIDIKPGSDPNSINLKSKGVIPVAILGHDAFDVTTANVTTLSFGPSGASPAHDLTNSSVLSGHLKDVNGDGYMDLVCHFRTQETGIAQGDDEVTLTGQTTGGTPITGTDSVNIVPKGKGKK